MSHSLYSPDMAPNAYHLFANLKNGSPAKDFRPIPRVLLFWSIVRISVLRMGDYIEK